MRPLDGQGAFAPSVCWYTHTKRCPTVIRESSVKIRMIDESTIPRSPTPTTNDGRPSHHRHHAEYDHPQPPGEVAGIKQEERADPDVGQTVAHSVEGRVIKGPEFGLHPPAPRHLPIDQVGPPADQEKEAPPADVPQPVRDRAHEDEEEADGRDGIGADARSDTRVRDRTRQRQPTGFQPLGDQLHSRATSVEWRAGPRGEGPPRAAKCTKLKHLRVGSRRVGPGAGRRG